jgi:hypothetical protein
MSTTNEVIEPETESKSISSYVSLIVMCIIFSISIGLYFSFIYSPNGGASTFFSILFGALVLGYITTIIYYRGNILSKTSPLDKPAMYSIFGSTSASFMVLFITMFAINVNPNLITIFENTIGIWVLSVMGNDQFISEIFTSDAFKVLNDQSDSLSFNYNFLLTRLNPDNIGKFIEFYRDNVNNTSDKKSEVDFPFDFKPLFRMGEDGLSQLNKLEKMIEMKRSVGYFTWVYLTSIVSLIISIIAVTMKI